MITARGSPSRISVICNLTLAFPSTISTKDDVRKRGNPSSNSLTSCLRKRDGKGEPLGHGDDDNRDGNRKEVDDLLEVLATKVLEVGRREPPEKRKQTHMDLRFLLPSNFMLCSPFLHPALFRRVLWLFACEPLKANSEQSDHCGVRLLDLNL
jgi:hypothetical protein